MSVARYAAVALSVVAGLAVAPAAAHGQWRAEPVPSQGLVGQLGFAFDAGGRGLLTWEGIDPQRSPTRFTGVDVRDPASGWRRAGDLPSVTWGGAEIHLFGRTRAMLVSRQTARLGRFNRAQFRLVYAFGRSDGSFAALRTLADDVTGFVSAANRAGDAMVAFVDRRAGAARVAERRAGHAFSAPRTLARPGGAVAAAMNARGDRALAWWGRDGVFARVRRAGGGWGPVLRAARAQPTANGLIRAAITPAGRVVLAWQTADLRESQPLRLAAGAAVGSAGQAWRSFTLERSTLASASFSEDASAIPLVDSAKRVYVIWTGVADGHLAVKLARIAASSPGPTVVLSGPVVGAAVDDAAAGLAGSLAVSWSVLRGAFSVTYASLRRGTGKFAAPERLTPEGARGLGGSRVAFQPLTGEAIVTWGFVTADERGAVRASVSPAP